MLCTARHVWTRVPPEVTLWRTRPRDNNDVSGNGFIGQNMELGCYRIVMVAWGILILMERRLWVKRKYAIIASPCCSAALSSPCQKVSMRVTEANIWLHRPPLAWRHLPKQDKQIWWS